MVNRKGDAATQFLNEVFDKMETKLMGLEQNFSLMTPEQKRALDNQGKIELTTMKNSEEFKSVLSQL